MAQKTNNITSDTLWLVGGSVVGAGLALLLAPKSGKKTRSDIARFGKDLGRISNRTIRKVSSNVSGFADKTGDRAVDILHNGRALSKKAKWGILSAFERGQDTLEYQKRKLARMIG